MVKEINYFVVPSMLSPEERIFCGTMRKDKQNRGIWVTRCDVTGMVINSFLEHYVAKVKESNPKGNGMEYNYNDVNGYSVKLIIEKLTQDKTKGKDVSKI
jgi:hypothetical protein